MILGFFVDLLGLLLGGPHRFGRRVSLELPGLMQSSRRFQWRSGRPGQSDTANSRSHLLLLLRATHDCCGVGRLIREAEGEDTIADAVVGRYHLAKASSILTSRIPYIGRPVELNGHISQNTTSMHPVSFAANRLLDAVAEQQSFNIRRWLIKWLES